MSIHIGAEAGDIAETILLPGDPLRAKYIAETMLENAVCYNEVRGMYGFTGTYKGKKVSVQGTGMGQPSLSIYVNELISYFHVKNLIRVGTCGAIQSHLRMRDVILAMTASTDSSMNKIRFQGNDYAPAASFTLLKKAHDVATQMGVNVEVGSILSSDTFYDDDPDSWKKWAAFGVLAIEMESSALYTLAAKFNVNALTLCTVTDSLVTQEQEPSEAREKAVNQMVEIALEIAV
ncbi:MAG: purine-nucleoside phosphorylase [SAR324 cluster bacterium]|nr:purine-nucleoside phosphorylase [SAR324 cluster bacterium]